MRRDLDLSRGMESSVEEELGGVEEGLLRGEKAHRSPKESHNERWSNLTSLVCGLAIIALVMTAAFVRSATKVRKEPLNPQKYLVSNIDAQSIRKFSRILTEKPHLAGTPQDKEQADWVSSQWKQFGLDSVKIVPYNVLLSYPRMDKPNQIHVIDANGNEVYSTKGRQDPLWAEEESSPLVRPNFNAYSQPGSPEGDLVYVNYGRREDYDKLKELGVSTEGKILLVKYGRIFRGNIAKFAEEHGAVGVVLFSDPKDFAREGRDKVYPHTVFLPGMAVQSGTIWLQDGDPITPFYPSIDSAFRLNETEVGLPKIPVQPIGYDEAEEFLKRLAGPDAPEDWQGGLSVKYKLGPGFTNNEKTRMEIYTTNTMATTYNVIGVLKGSVEPDRHVLLGNHRDAWILGSVDPSSGTAAMMEIARAMGKLKVDEGWRPRRSIVFCSWGAEEYGLIGSVEWTEENAKMLSASGVVYLNVDMALDGNYTLRALGVPLVYQSLFDAAKVIPNPNPEEIQAGRPTVFDTWAHHVPSDHDPAVPRVRSVGSGSDYKGFMHNLGIPSLDIRYSYAQDIGSYPLYHTLYETFNLVDLLMDQGFHYSKAVTQMWAELTRVYADSPVIPFKVEDYAKYLIREFDYIRDTYGPALESHGASLEYFESAVANFSSQAERFQMEVSSVDSEDLYALRSINDRLMQVERSFLDPRGLPDRPAFNHVVFAPSSGNSYAGTSFTGLSDLLYEIDKNPDQAAAWKAVKKHLSAIAYLVQAAAQTMSGDLTFRGE